MKLLIFSLFLTGCATAGPIDMITPTVVPPLTEELGYEVPNFKGVTTPAIIKGCLVREQLKLKIWDESAHLTLKATEQARDGLLGLLATLGIGSAGIGIPVALRRLPKGAVTKEEYEKAKMTAPEEF